MPKKPQGKEVKKAYGVRLEPAVYEAIVNKFGSFTEFVNRAVKNARIKGAKG